MWLLPSYQHRTIAVKTVAIASAWGEQPLWSRYNVWWPLVGLCNISSATLLCVEECRAGLFPKGLALGPILFMLKSTDTSYLRLWWHLLQSMSMVADLFHLQLHLVGCSVFVWEIRAWLNVNEEYQDWENNNATRFVFSQSKVWESNRLSASSERSQVILRQFRENSEIQLVNIKISFLLMYYQWQGTNNTNFNLQSHYKLNSRSQHLYASENQYLDY